MKTIEIGIIIQKEYSENDTDLTNVKEEIRVIKVKGTTHGIKGFFQKYFFVGYFEVNKARIEKNFNYTFYCKLRDFKYLKEL